MRSIAHPHPRDEGGPPDHGISPPTRACSPAMRASPPPFSVLVCCLHLSAALHSVPFTARRSEGETEKKNEKMKVAPKIAGTDRHTPASTENVQREGGGRAGWANETGTEEGTTAASGAERRLRTGTHRASQRSETGQTTNHFAGLLPGDPLRHAPSPRALPCRHARVSLTRKRAG